jgi:hypothetical protein
MDKGEYFECLEFSSGSYLMTTLYTTIKPENDSLEIFNRIEELSVKSPCLHPIFGPTFTPIFEWYPQSKEILLNLRFSIYCTRFETSYSIICTGRCTRFETSYSIICTGRCTRFETSYSIICTGRSSENICSSSGGAQQKRKDRMKLSLSPKLVEKLVWVLSYFTL